MNSEKIIFKFLKENRNSQDQKLRLYEISGSKWFLKWFL